MKTCSKCNRDLPESSFYARNDGKARYWCKDCILSLNSRPERGKAASKYARSEKGRESLSRYRSTEKYKEAKRAWESEYRQRPDVKVKRSARARIRYRVKTGQLPPASECDCYICGEKAQDYHHYNGYDENDVKPICKHCHMNIESQYKKKW